jgi:hypothetical protein
MPLHERRKRLAGLLSGNDALCFSTGRGRKRRGSVPTCLRDGARRHVSKQIATPYRSGLVPRLAQDQVPALRPAVIRWSMRRVSS